jgi:hypothetical protein
VFEPGRDWEIPPPPPPALWLGLVMEEAEGGGEVRVVRRSVLPEGPKRRSMPRSISAMSSIQGA